MPKLNKGALALTFKFDCDRFLRIKLANNDEKQARSILEVKDRPGIELMQAAGKLWEAEKYQDLIDTLGSDKVVFELEKDVDTVLGRKPFKKITNLFEILGRDSPPVAIIEAEFLAPTSITPALQKTYEEFKLDPVRVRPDILWIRPSGTGTSFIGKNKVRPKYEIHIIDVKMAAEPSLKHFTEVTYYALALATAIEEAGLDKQYAVSAEGNIWPGNHDTNAFRSLVQSYVAKGSKDPCDEALRDTLKPVPYESYEYHVKQFFEDRLPRVLRTNIEDTSWHVSSKCQLCEYSNYCLTKAGEVDHLSRVAWLNEGQANLLRLHNINTTAQLAEAISSKDERWQSAIASSPQLRASGLALEARTRSLATNTPIPIEGRRCGMMPGWTDQSIFITVHFDPGSGISFALGAKRLYFPHGRKPGDPPKIDEKVFIVDRVMSMNPATERERLKEFTTVVAGWLEEVSRINTGLPARERLSSHIFFWDTLELRQLKRMFERHMDHPDVLDLLDVLVRFFPPDNVLPDLDAFISQPGTVVKDVIKTLVGLPLAHNYSLLETANSLIVKNIENGSNYSFKLPFGFSTLMSDQIPFERAYELWQDKILLKHFNEFQHDYSKWQSYTRDEIYEGIKSATKVHLNALQHIVRILRENYKDRLTLKKGAFSASRSTQKSVPEPSRSLITFEKLNATCQKIENKNIRALPIDEREARFFSIRGLIPLPENEKSQALEQLRLEQPEYQNTTLYAFSFSTNSRDARFKERDFMVALSNESEDKDLDEPWRHRLGLSYAEAEVLMQNQGLTDDWILRKSVGDLLQVILIKLEASQDKPYLVLRPDDERLFNFALQQGIVTFDSPLVLDPMYKDFSSSRVEKTLIALGGQPAPIKRAKSRKQKNG